MKDVLHKLMKEEYKMRILFEMDKKDYVPNGSVFSRPSARAIIIKDGKIAMVYSKKYNYYKFPGGGIEVDECMEDALIREVLREQRLSYDMPQEISIICQQSRCKPNWSEIEQYIEV